MEEYQIALAHELGISAADFVAAWNSDPDARKEGEASMDQTGRANYDLSLFIGALLSIPAGLATNALSELIKNVLDKHGVDKRTHIEIHEQADGSRLLVIDIDE